MKQIACQFILDYCGNLSKLQFKKFQKNGIFSTGTKSDLEKLRST